MSILVFGRSGQVARALAAHPGTRCLGRDAVDLRDPAAIAAAIAAAAPTAVINAAAFTAVDDAESDEATAQAINADAPGAMARACAARDIPFVHISTDYVFSGAGNRPWQPTDTPAPINAYGRTKRAGEIAVAAAQGRHAILRTSWVFAETGRNFVTTIRAAAQTRTELRVVDDQIGGPTPATAIAQATLEIAAALGSDATLSGTYHLSGAPDVSWADFAAAILAPTHPEVVITPIPTEAFPTKAPRPRNSRLGCVTTQAVFGIARPDWRDALTEPRRASDTAP